MYCGKKMKEGQLECCSKLDEGERDEWMERLTDKQKLSIFRKEGYDIHYVNGKYDICFSVDRVIKERDFIDTYYLHLFDCCNKCKRKVYRQRYKIKKSRKWENGEWRISWFD